MTDSPLESQLSRRGFLTSTAALALAGAIPRRAGAVQPESAPPRFFSWQQAAPNVWFAASPDGAPTLGGNSTLLLGPDSATLIDTKYPVLGPCLRREAASFGKPLATIINTHHHADHTGGNPAFTPDLPVISHAAAIPRVKAQLQRYADGIPGMAATLSKLEGDLAKAVAAEAQDLAAHTADLKPEQFTPTRAIDLNTDLDLSLKLRALHPGPAHTDNDIALFLPDANVLIAGDLLFHDLHPFLDRASGGTSAGWIKALAALIPLCDDKTVVIPGHGLIADRDALQRQSDYLEGFRELMAQAVKEGKPKEQATKTPVPAAYQSYGLQQIFPATLSALYDEAVAEAAAAPGGTK